MKIQLFKSSLIILIFFYLNQIAIADTVLIPTKKPILSKEGLKQKISKNYLIPQKKPIAEKPIITEKKVKEHKKKILTK